MRLVVTVAVLAALGIAPGVAAGQQMTDADLRRWVAYAMDLEERVGRQSGDVQLMVRLADAYAQMGDMRRALPALESLGDLGVDPVRIALIRGDAYLRARQWDEAVSAYLEALSHAPRQPHALAQLWSLVLQVTLTGDEVSFDRRAVTGRLQREGLFFPGAYEPEADAPERASRLVSRASALLPGRPEEATAPLMQAITLDPANARAFATLGRAYHAQRDFDPAVGAYLVYLLLAPDADDADDVRRYVAQRYEQARDR